MGRAGLVIASGTMVSRVLGFANLAVLNWAIGVDNPSASAFAIANTLPTTIFLLISGGLLSAVLVPQIVRAAAQDDGGSRFVSRLLTLAVLVFAVVTVIATLSAPLLVQLNASSGVDGQLGSAGFALAVGFAYWCLPQIFFYALYSLLGEVLNARGVFGPFTWVPAVNNVVAIAVSLTFVGVFGRTGHRQPSTWDGGEIALLAGGMTLGIVAQAVGLLLFWRRTGLRYRPDLRLRGVGLGGAGRAAGWTFGMIVVNQLAAIVQNQVLLVVAQGDASVRAAQTAWLLFLLPHSVITMSIAAPYFTRMSAHAHAGDRAAVRADLAESLRTVVALVAGAAAALAAAAFPLAAALAPTVPEAISIGSVLLAYLVGLLPFSILFLVQRSFFALGDTRTPFFIQLLQSGVFLVGALIAVQQPSALIAVGVALSTAVSITVQLVVSLVLLRRPLGGLDGARIASRVGVLAVLTIPASGAGLLVAAALGGIPGVGDGFALTTNAGSALVSAAAIGAASLLVYVGLLRVIRAPELTAALAAVRRRAP
ncbi:MAG: hypothetical protein HY996_12200 [Micrococcales bacterium]|nr:hypothetical protein [Micrococcales bacterium]